MTANDEYGTYLYVVLTVIYSFYLYYNILIHRGIQILYHSQSIDGYDEFIRVLRNITNDFYERESLETISINSLNNIDDVPNVDTSSNNIRASLLYHNVHYSSQHDVYYLSIQSIKYRTCLCVILTIGSFVSAYYIVH